VHRKKIVGQAECGKTSGSRGARRQLTKFFGSFCSQKEPRKVFFFEKKKQKTFINLVGGDRRDLRLFLG
jgi:hypothetical protein